MASHSSVATWSASENRMTERNGVALTSDDRTRGRKNRRIPALTMTISAKVGIAHARNTPQLGEIATSETRRPIFTRAKAMFSTGTQSAWPKPMSTLS